MFFVIFFLKGISDSTYIDRLIQLENCILKFSIFFPMFIKILPKLSKISLVSHL